MESPGKVIAAFVGVFAAGAVFGGFFAVGIGSRWAADQATSVAASTASVAPAPAPAPVPVATAPVLASAPASSHPVPAVQRPPLLQLPFGWQAPQLMRRYAERLELTPEQKERILPVIQRSIEDYRRVQQATFRETGIILQRLQQDIGKELTPEQLKKLETMEERQRELLQKVEQRRTEQRKGVRPPEKTEKTEKPPTDHAPESGGAAPAAPASTVSTSGSDTTQRPAPRTP